jgi:hypothetical protein
MQNFTPNLFMMSRETVEAMLVVGIQYAWLSHHPAAQRGLKYLWGGVLAGLGGAFLLLLPAFSLLIGSAEKLMDVQLLPVIKLQTLDISMLLDDGSVFGSVISSFAGYRARPALMSLIVFIGYWLVIRLMMHPDRKPSSKPEPA